MEKIVLSLLEKADNADPGQAPASLNEAFMVLKNANDAQPKDAPQSVPEYLFALCAETAMRLQQREIANACLQTYFSKCPVIDQYTCRAYLCQAELVAPTTATTFEDVERMAVYILKCVYCARENIKWHYLVYNASVLFWQLTRPFMKANYFRCLSPTFVHIVKVLDDINDRDYEWRGQLVMLLLQSYLDAGDKANALTFANKYLPFLKDHAPRQFREMFVQMVRYQLIDMAKLQKDTKLFAALSVTFRLCKLKTAIEDNEEINVAAEISSILKAATGEAETSNTLQIGGASTTSKRSTDRDRDKDRDKSAKRAAEKAEKADKAETGGTRGSLKGEWRDQSNRGNILLELARLAIKVHCYDVANDCLVAMQQESIASADMKDASVVLGAQFARCEVAAAQLPNNFTKPVVDARLKIVERCEELLVNASRIQKPNVVQGGCSTLWNLVQPLLQNELRHHVLRALSLCAEQLEQTNSLLSQLRTQVHIELANCYEQQQQISNALEHLEKALLLDEEGTQLERIELLRGRLRLRTDLYLVPKRVEEEAAMILEQLQTAQRHSEKRGSHKAAVGGSSQRALLTQAGSVLSPDAFLEVLQGEEEQALLAADLIQRTEIMHAKVGRYRSTIGKAEGHVRRMGVYNDKERVPLWTDLVKLARKQEVWDIVRVAARFCLSYDDNRWHVPVVQVESTSKKGKKKADKRAEQHEDAANGAGAANAAQPQDTSGTAGAAPAAPIQAPVAGLPDAVAVALDGVVQPDAMQPEAEQEFVPPPNFTPKRSGLSLFERDLIRMLAETHLIYAEAHIQHLLSMNIRYCDEPQKPSWTERQLKLIKIRRSTANNADQWTTFFDWVRELHKIILASLTRAVQLATDLQEPHLITNVCCILWNYGYHLLTEQRHRTLLEQFKVCFDAYRKLNQFPDSKLLINLTCALAQGYLQPWIPKEFLYGFNPAAVSNLKTDDVETKKEHAKRNVVSPPSKKTAPAIANSAEAQQDLKDALETCAFTMQLTAGDNPKHSASNRVRHPLLQLWTVLKQFSQQQINKHLGADDSDSKDSSRPFTRAIVGVEMMWINNNGVCELRETPDFKEIVALIDACDWVGRDERVLELELWTRLTFLAFGNAMQLPTQGNVASQQQQNSEIFSKLVQRALTVYQDRELSRLAGDSTESSTVFEQLAHCWCLQGRFVMNVAKPSQKTRLQAIKCFSKAAVLAKMASNYRLVSYASRCFWNAAYPLTSDAVDRRVLREDLGVILDAFIKTADGKILVEIGDMAEEQAGVKNDEEKEKEKEKEEAEEQQQLRPVSMFEIQIKHKLGLFFLPLQAPHLLVFKLKADMRDDLSLRTTMTAVLFQICADDDNWEDGIKVLDEAINNMPKTKHRLALIQHRLLVKARLGKSVYADMQKFKDEDERTLAAMWRRVALCTTDVDMQILAFQRAIETLTMLENEWQKCEYLLEFATCLFNHGFSAKHCTRAVEWAIDILLNFAIVEQLRARSEVTSSRESAAQKSALKASKTATETTVTVTVTATATVKSKKSKEDSKRKSTSTKHHGQTQHTEVSNQMTLTQRSEATNGSNTPFVMESGVSPTPRAEEHPEIAPTRRMQQIVLEDVQDVQLLDLLTRAYLQLALLAGPNAPDREANVLQAAACLLQTLRVSIGAAHTVLRTGGKTGAGAQPVPTEKPPKAKSKDGQKESKDKQTKRKTVSYDGVPASWAEWAVFEVSDEMLDALRQVEYVRKRGPSTQTLTQPEMSLYYVRQLREQLAKLGHLHVTLPVLVYESLLCKLFLPDLSCCQLLVRLRLIKTCSQLNLLAAAGNHDKVLAELRISDDDRARARAQIAVWQEKNRRLQLASDLSPKTRKKDPKDAGPDPDSTAPTSTSTELLQTGELRHVWIHIASTLVDLGMYQYAREYLFEAAHSADALRDVAAKRDILLLLAKLALLEKDCSNALVLAQRAVAANPFDDGRTRNVARLEAQIACDVHLRAATIMADCMEQDVTRKLRLRDAMMQLSSQMAVVMQYYNEKRAKLADRPVEEQAASCAELEWCVLQFEAKLLDLQIKQCARYLENCINAMESSALCERRLSNLLRVLEKWRENYEASFDYEPRVAIRMMLRHAQVLETVPKYVEQLAQTGLRPRPDDDPLHERRVYVSVYTLYRRAIALAQAQYSSAMEKFDSPGTDCASVCLPAEREYADLRLHYCLFLLKLFRIYSHELEQRKSVTRDKDNLQLAHDVFLQDEVSHYELSDQSEIANTKWLRLGAELPDEIAQTLLEAQHLVRNHKPTITAKILAYLGVCWHLHAQAVGPDAPMQWSFAQLDSEIMKTSAYVRQARDSHVSGLQHQWPTQNLSLSDTIYEVNEPQANSSVVDPDALKWQQRVTNYKRAFDLSMSYLRLSTQYLGQTVNMCLDSPYASTIHAATLTLASFELVEVLAQFDPSNSAQFMMLAQSSQFAKFAIQVLSDLLFDTKKSQCAALLNQLQLLIDTDLIENGTNTPLFDAIDTALMKTTEAWPRLKLSRNHLDLTKEFALNFNFSVLQFNEDRSALYAAIFDKQQFKSKGSKPTVSHLQSRTTVIKLDNSNRSIDYLWVKFSMHKSELMRELLRLENKRSQIAERKRLLETVSGGDRDRDDDLLSRDESMSLLQNGTVGDDAEFEKHDVQLFNQECEFQFWTLVQELDQIVRPFTKQLEFIHRPLSATTETKSISTSKHEREATDLHSRGTTMLTLQQTGGVQPSKETAATDYIILLCDVLLFDLPLEALNVFQHTESICSVTRDFSLQLHYRRAHVVDLPTSADQKAAQAQEEREKKKTGMSRIPALRDANKTKPGKGPNLDRQVPPWCTSVDVNNFRFIVDPHFECRSLKASPIAHFQHVMQREQACTARWLGVLGNDHVPSLAEYEVYMKEGTSFIFYGVERLQYEMPFSRIASLSVPDCAIAALFDMVQTVKSNLRVAKLEIDKLPTEIDYESNPVLRALLVSLAGVSCVLTNQWYTTLNENAEKFNVAMRTLLGLGKSTGESCRILQSAARKSQISVVPASAHSTSRQRAASSSNANAPALSTVESSRIIVAGTNNSVNETSTNATGRTESNEETSLVSGQSEQFSVKREWYNMVCYGLPNLIANNTA